MRQKETFQIQCKQTKAKQLLMIVSLILITGFTFGQSTDDRYGKPTDYLSEIKMQDITYLWATENTSIYDNTPYTTKVLGFIGNDYQRFYIHFISTIQNPTNHLEYFVYGKTRVKENICSFQGLITITEAKTFLVEDNPKQKQGFVKGKYEFYEDPNQKSSGILKGTFQTDFYFDSIRGLQYGVIIWGDGYFNNAFVGTWSDYKSGVTKICNWGYEGIPESGSLVSTSATWFLPDDKFAKFGWDNYIKAYRIEEETPANIEFRKKENEKWWLDKK